jgi:Trypsin-like peptidase domain
MPTIDQYSAAAIPIEMLFNETRLSIATSFVWKVDDNYWLITNWHNVSGRDSNTGKHISNTAAEPNQLRIYFNAKGYLGSKVTKVVDIRGDTETPLWLVHPTHGNKVDVVALPIQNYDDVDMFAINTLQHRDLLIEVGMDVFVLGFPFGTGPHGLPIWKRGSIASEPDLAGTQQPLYFIVDTASRPGMSGSPVIRRSWGTHTMTDGSVGMGATSATKFIGVYSGRLATKDPLDAQLRLTWPASFVSEIIAGRRADT